MIRRLHLRSNLLLASIVLASILIGCSKKKSSNKPAPASAAETPKNPNSNGTVCVPSEESDGLKFTCDDGKVYQVKNGRNGKDGVDGEDGDPGKDGIGCTLKVTEDELIFTCANGEHRIPREKSGGGGSVGENPLLAKSPLPYGAYQWDKIKPEHIVPALKLGIIKAKKIFDQVVNDSNEPTFQNTIEALELADTGLTRSIRAYFGVSALLQDQYSVLEKEINPILNEYGTYFKNKKYHAKIKSLYEDRKTLDLTPLQMRMLETIYEEQVRDGLALEESAIQKVAAIDLKIADLKAKFSRNGVQSKETFNLHIENAEDLKGLPKHVISAAAERAKQQKKDGYVLNLDTSVWANVLDNADNRELRKLYFLSRQRIGFDKGPLPEYDGSEFDNRQIIIDIAKLRLERAKILGFKNHAEWKLQDKMASSPEKVMAFMDDLLEPVKRQSEKEIALLYEFKRQKGDTSLIKQWDVRYWAEQYRKEKLGVDSQEIRKYFELKRVLHDGVFFQGEQFWGFSFEKIDNLPTFHEDVLVYKAKDEKGQDRALLYLDLYARKGKRSGAWMSPLRQRDQNQPVAIIHVALNLPKPAVGEPTLLSIDEARTLFHEFGHAYHTFLSDVKYASMAGSSVAWDFVEVPSQVPEAFVSIKEVLKNYARHYQTDEVIPDELIQKIDASRKFMIGEFELRQMRLAYTDMAWYLNNPLPSIETVGAFEKAAMKKATHEALAYDEEVATSANFGHIFAGGYDAGYYGYQWARVIGADLFAAFTEDDGFSMEKAKPVAQKLRETILSRGNSSHPAVLFRNFRGRDYKKDFFLETLGAKPNDQSGDIPRHRLSKAM